MMLCNHVSTKRVTPGQQDTCLICQTQIIVNSDEKWVWLFGLSPKERRQLTTVYAVNRMVGDKLG